MSTGKTSSVSKNASIASSLISWSGKVLSSGDFICFRCDLSKSNSPALNSSLGSLIVLFAETDKEIKLPVLLLSRRRSKIEGCFLTDLELLKLKFFGRPRGFKLDNR